MKIKDILTQILLLKKKDFVQKIIEISFKLGYEMISLDC